MASEVAEITLMTDGFKIGETARSADAGISALAERARAGNTAAFEQIVILTQRKVLMTAWRLLGNQDDARDAAQEVFLRAFKYLSSYRADQDFAAWLYRITVNVCRDAGRKRGQILFTSFEDERDAAFDAAASDENLEAAAIRSEQRRLVADALETLTKKEREALVLRDLEGLPTEEVARLLGTSAPTVRSQVSAARAKIKQFHERLLRRTRR